MIRTGYNFCVFNRSFAILKKSQKMLKLDHRQNYRICDIRLRWFVKDLSKRQKIKVY